uniref:Uncharacterized protein n=1 Tax=Alexandrium catenella TaxID=2925 RepID=A0A7S1RJA1_ALECA
MASLLGGVSSPRTTSQPMMNWRTTEGTRPAKGVRESPTPLGRALSSHTLYLPLTVTLPPRSSAQSPGGLPACCPQCGPSRASRLMTRWQSLPTLPGQLGWEHLTEIQSALDVSEGGDTGTVETAVERARHKRRSERQKRDPDRALLKPVRPPGPKRLRPPAAAELRSSTLACKLDTRQMS